MNQYDTADINNFMAMVPQKPTSQFEQDLCDHHKMILHWARRYRSHVPMCELLQAGMIGLDKARQTYDPTVIGRTGKPVPFGQWAWNNVRYEIRKAAIPAAPKDGDGNVIEVLSMSSLIYEDTELWETIPSNIDVLEEIIQEENNKQQRVLIERVPDLLKRLTPLEYEIVSEWVSTGSLRDTGLKWNLSHESAREIKDRALEKMKQKEYPIQSELLDNKSMVVQPVPREKVIKPIRPMPEQDTPIVQLSLL